MPALAPDSLVVITGITGYIASHIGVAALRSGYRVRGTVRDMSKTNAVRAAYEVQGVDFSAPRLEFVLLNNLGSAEQYEGAFAGADAVVHVAIPEPSAEWVSDTVASVMVPLGVASKEKGVKRFVLTSSFVTAVTPGQVPEGALDENSWNDQQVEHFKTATAEHFKTATAEDKQKPDFFWTQYFVAKTLSEQAAWEFVKTEQPAFEFSTILPTTVWGPVIYGPPKLTVNWLVGLVKSDPSVLHWPPQWFVDVRDCARLHVLALEQPELAGKRVWAGSGPFGWNQILEILRKEFPGMKESIPRDVQGPMGDANSWKIDSELARKALGGEWIALDKCVVDTLKSIGIHSGVDCSMLEIGLSN